jgi:hypothetical protein
MSMARDYKPSHRECILVTRCGCKRTIIVKEPVDEYIRVPLELNTVHISTTNDIEPAHMTIPIRIFKRKHIWRSSMQSNRPPTRNELQYYFHEVYPND